MIAKLTAEVTAKIKTIEDTEQLQELIASYCEQLQIDYFMLSFFRAESLQQPDLFMLDNYPKGWCDYYHEYNFYAIDPLTAYCFEHALPISWHELLGRPEFLDARFQIMLQRAKDFGLYSGLTIPLSSTFGFKGIFNLASRQDAQQSQPLFDRACPYLLLLSTHIMQWFKQHQVAQMSQSTETQTLTHREYECLFWACEGKSSWEIAQILSITERTVIFHLNHVMQKLGANSRQHAVAKGLLKQLVRPKLVK